MIRVCVVEDQTLVREGLESLLHLTDDIKVVACAADGIAALERVRTIRPDIVLLDLAMPKLDGLGFMREALKQGETTPVVILTTFDDDVSILEGIRLGAKGYLMKDATFALLTEAVRTVAAGGTMISPVVTERLRRGLTPVTKTIPALEMNRLSNRELEVLRLMVAGFSNSEIAEAVFLAEGTVKNHVSHILSKLGARDRVRAVLKAIEVGYV